MKNSVKTNYVYNLLFQVLNIVTPLITMPYVSRVLGADGIGKYSYIFSIVTYFLMFASLGTTLYGCREIANVFSNKQKKSVIFHEVLSIRLIASAIIIVCYLLFIRISISQTEEKKLLIVCVLYILGTAFDISWFFQGEQEFQIITIITIIVKLVTILATFFFIRDAGDILLYVLLHALMAFVNSILYFVPLRQRIEKVSIREINLIKHLKPVLILLVPQISKEVYAVLDKTMIGSLYVDRALNGYYEQASNIASMSMTVITSLNIVMMSRLSQDYTNKKNEAINKGVAGSFQFVWFLGLPLCFGIASVIDLFVPFFFGAGYEPVVDLVYMLIPRIMIIGISNVIGIQYLITLKRHVAFNTSIVLGLLGNVILNAILIPRYSIYGAAISTVISEGIVTTTQLLFIRKELKLRLVFPKEIIQRLIASIMMFICITAAKEFLGDIALMIQILLCVCLGVGIYVAFEILLKDKLMDDLLMLVKDGIQKRSKV